MLALSHPREAVARRECGKILRQLHALRNITADWQAVHAEIKALDPFRDNLQEFAAGLIDRMSMPIKLQHMLARWLLMKVVETSIEGKHALVKCRLSRRETMKTSGPLFSSELRFNEFKDHVAKKSTFNSMLKEFALCRDLCYVVDQFGLSNHKHLQQCLEEDGELTVAAVASAYYHIDSATNFLPHNQERQRMERQRASERDRLRAQVVRGPICRGYARCVWKAAVEHMQAKCSAGHFYGCTFHPDWHLCTFQERSDLRNLVGLQGEGDNGVAQVPEVGFEDLEDEEGGELLLIAVFRC